ncbi:hypothetical protein [Macrococcoides canis]|nr:hypothetical protein [Macrococcus canis]
MAFVSNRLFDFSKCLLVERRQWVVTRAFRHEKMQETLLFPAFLFD